MKQPGKVTFSYVGKNKPAHHHLTHPEGGSASGVIIPVPSILTYDPDAPDAAWLSFDPTIEPKRLDNPVQQRIELPHCYCIIMQAELAHDRYKGPCLTMHEYGMPQKKPWKEYGSKIGTSHYAYTIHFPGKIRILYTDGPAYIGNRKGQGAKLWVESELKPTPKPRWYSREEFKVARYLGDIRLSRAEHREARQ